MKASQAVTITCFSTPFGTAGRGAVILGPHCFFRAIPPIGSPMPVFRSTHCPESSIGDHLVHDVLELDRLVPLARGTNDLVSRTRHTVPSAVHGRAWTKNRENNPMQSRVNPGSQHSCCAASGREKKNAPSSRPQPNLIPL